jgi:hypothetical protein
VTELVNDASGRLAEFQAEIDRLKIRGSAPTTEQRLLTAGIVLMPVGALLVLVGWWGASGTTEVSSQIPYLISGGVLGLVCTVAGGALFLRYSLARYLRYWLLRLVYEERASTDRNVDALARIEELLRKQ